MMESLHRPMRVYEGAADDRPTEAAPAFQLDVVRSVRLHSIATDEFAVEAYVEK